MTIIVSLASMLVLGQTAAKEKAAEVPLDVRVVVWRNAVTEDDQWWPARFLVMNVGKEPVEVPRWPINYDFSPSECRWHHSDCGLATYPANYTTLEPGEVTVWRAAVPRRNEYADQRFNASVSFDAYVGGEKRSVCLEAVVGRSRNRDQLGKVSSEKPVEQPSKSSGK